MTGMSSSNQCLFKYEVAQHWQWLKWAHKTTCLFRYEVAQHWQWLKWAHKTTCLFRYEVAQHWQWLKWAHKTTCLFKYEVAQHWQWLKWAHKTTCLFRYSAASAMIWVLYLPLQETVCIELFIFVNQHALLLSAHHTVHSHASIAEPPFLLTLTSYSQEMKPDIKHVLSLGLYFCPQMQHV